MLSERPIAERVRLAEQLRGFRRQIAGKVTEVFLLRHPDWVARYGERARRFGVEDAIFHQDFLAAAIETGDPRAFAEYLRDPVVEVTLLRRISVTGSVVKPGLYPVDPSMTVMDALALAGGASSEGRRDRVELRRAGVRSLALLERTSIVADLRLRSGDQLFVPQKPWLSRNTWLVSTLIGATATITTIVLTR